MNKRVFNKITLMKYYRLLNFKKETFSNSPDPDMLFKSGQHLACLERLEPAIRQQRGLSVVIGATGIGKTTLSRQLLRLLNTAHQHIQARLIIDPKCSSAREFLQAIGQLFELRMDNEPTAEQLKDNIKKYLFEQAAERGKIPVLIIDDGQKLPDFALEILDTFLTFETNRQKLLQVVIFAREEFNLVLQNKANLTGHIATHVNLRPFSLSETKQMIAFRLSRSHHKSTAAPRIFSPSAILLIHLLSGGYPHRIVALCSRLIITLLIKNKQRAGLFDLLSSLKDNTQSAQPHRRGLIIIIYLSVITAIVLGPELFHHPKESGLRQTILQGALAKAEKTKPVSRTAEMPHSPAQRVKPLKSRAARQETACIPMRIEPAVLGRLPVHQGDIPSKMIARVYGRYTGSRMKLVQRANKGLNLKQLRPGLIIKFPGEARINFQPAAHEFWLQLKVQDTLKAAVDILKAYPASAPPIISVPARRSAKDKAAFMIVLEKRFKKKSAAAAILKSLPPSLRKEAIIRHQ